jgi:hypothetical protein
MDKDRRVLTATSFEGECEMVKTHTVCGFRERRKKLVFMPGA